jgi:hypothetical protein
LLIQSTDFSNRDYYTNIKKALCAGMFMQVVNNVITIYNKRVHKRQQPT